jgi:hypothetical protein
MIIASQLSHNVGCHALQLEARTDSLVSFYQDIGFQKMSQSNRLMFMTISTIRIALAAVTAASPISKVAE